MQDYTRRTLLQGGTALAATGALTGPALFDFAKAWAQASPWKAEPGAKLTVMRWKRFVPAEDDAFNAMVAAFKTATGVEMNVFSESFEDVQPKATVAANTGSGLDVVWGLHTLPQLFPTQVLQMNDVADYLGKKYGGWTDAAAITRKQSNNRLGIPVGRAVLHRQRHFDLCRGEGRSDQEGPHRGHLSRALSGRSDRQADRTAAHGSDPGVQVHQIPERGQSLYRLHAGEGKLR